MSGIFKPLANAVSVSIWFTRLWARQLESADSPYAGDTAAVEWKLDMILRRLENTGRARKLTSLSELRRPLRTRKAKAARNARVSLEALRTLGPFVERGDEEAKIVAEALVRSLIRRKMVTRMHDRRRGPLPHFLVRIEKLVESFKDNIR